MSAAIWCKEHAPTKTIVHRMHDLVDETGLNALQLFVQNFKQADLTLTGTVRKATLVNQSTKVINPVSITLPSNRRTSTTATSNGGTFFNKGSHSHPRPEEGHGELRADASEDHEKICVTCSIDVSPRWWPCPARRKPVILPAETSVPLNGDHTHGSNPPMINGHFENGGGHVALAAAALHQDPRKPVPMVTEFQCHQCHCKKARKESTPPPKSPEQEPSRPPIVAPSPAQVSDVDVVQAVPRYSWPHAPPYPSNAPYGSWSRHSPTPQSVPHVNQLNGNHSPRINGVVPQQLNGQPQIGQPVQGPPRSPHQNGHISQVSNGYPASPHHMGSTGPHIQNGTYRPTPQHLTNGGPPPRAPEHPFAQSSAHMHARSSLEPPHASSPMTHPQARDPGSSQSNGARSIDGRVNGGASASPSLRNLLS